jgi:hypothetical protein
LLDRARQTSLSEEDLGMGGGERLEPPSEI